MPVYCGKCGHSYLLHLLPGPVRFSKKLTGRCEGEAKGKIEYFTPTGVETGEFKQPCECEDFTPEENRL
jgi:hypothetical protein